MFTSEEDDVLFEKEEPVINVVNVDDDVDIVDNNYTYEHRGWDAIEQFNSLRISKKTLNIPEPERVKTALTQLSNQKLRNKESHSLSLYALLESAGKLFGNGPKWSNPDRSQFTRLNAGRIETSDKPLVYIKKPKYICQKDEAYHYELQFPSEQQKLQAKNRYQKAIKFGLIVPNDSETFDYTVNQSPWELDKYKPLWEELSAKLKSEPWKSKSNVLKSYIKPKPKETVTTDTPVTTDALNNPVKDAIQSNKLNDKTVETIPQKQYSQFTFNFQPKDSNIAKNQTRLTELFNNKSQNINPQNRNDTLKDNESNIFNFTSQKKIIDELDYPSPNALGELDREIKNNEHYLSDLNNNIIDQHADVNLSNDTTEATNYVTWSDGSHNKVEFSSNGSNDVFRKPRKTFIDFSNNVNDQGITNVLDDGNDSDKESDDDTIEDDGYGGYSVDDPDDSNTDHGDQVDKITKTDLYKSINPNSTINHEKSLKDGEKNDIQGDKNHFFLKKPMTNSEKKKMKLELFNKMFEYEAEESEDENLSDPEYRKKIKLLRKKRLENPSDSEEFSSDDNLEELGDFLTTENNLNPNDEELAKQRFYADMDEEDDERLKRLLSIKERVKRLDKMKHTGRKAKGGLGYDYDLSDFESSEEDSGYENEFDEFTDDDGDAAASTGNIVNDTNKFTGEHAAKKRKDLILFAKELSTEQLELMDFLDFKLDCKLNVQSNTRNIDIDDIGPGSDNENKISKSLQLNAISLVSPNLQSETDKKKLRNALGEKAIGHFQGLIKRNTNTLNPFKCKVAKVTH